MEPDPRWVIWLRISLWSVCFEVVSKLFGYQSVISRVMYGSQLAN
uniref:Uncharacterized protein n=1 Tax=Anguilla anguilla TaxID=7936 RepID=A0A0E9R4B0_ANGAN